MRRSSKLFLTLLASAALNGCASTPPITQFDGEWRFIKLNADEPMQACLKEADVAKLREILIRCKAAQ